MKAYLVLSAVGSDRPGIVEGITKFILEHNCNLEDSRMAILGGEFALIILLSGTPEKVAKIQSNFAAYANHNSLIGAAKETQGPQARTGKGYVPFQIRAVGLDHEGIVHQVAHSLHQMGVNIESLDTQATSAPFTGAPMFSLCMRIAVPPELPLSELRSNLQEVCDLVNVDVVVQPA